MSFTRRSFLVGAGSGLSLLVLTACTPENDPTPTPRPTSAAPSLVPEPVGVQRSAWGADSFSRGSHSFMAVGATPEHREALTQPLGDRVFFAGEATSVVAAATVRGAIASGGRAALQVADAAAPGDRIAVIGAGAAGAEAARVLAARGFDVIVLEARNRVGGRIHTEEPEGWDSPVELGAWRLDGEADASLLVDLSLAGVGTVALARPVPDSDQDGPGDGDGDNVATPIETPEPTDSPETYRSAGAQANGNIVGPAALTTAVTWAESRLSDVSLETALDESGAASTAESTDSEGLEGSALLEQQLAAIAAIVGADAALLSSWFGVPEVPAEYRLVTGRFDQLVTETLDGVETFLSTAVLGIAWGDNGVSLRLGTGESLTVDRAVVTVPLGVLQTDGIEFDPLLPFTHRTAIAALGVGSVETVWLAFDEPFWSTESVAWNLVGTDDDITTWFNLEPVTGEAVLVGIVGGEAATRVGELDDEELIAAARRALEPFAEA